MNADRDKSEQPMMGPDLSREPWVRCPNSSEHDPHWHAIRAGNITLAAGMCDGGRPGDAGTPTDTPAPVQGRTQAHSDDERVQQWTAAAILRGKDDGNARTQRLLALADAEQAALVADNVALRAEVERMRAGEAEDGAPANSVPTPGQWVRRFNEATPDERLAAAERAIANSETVQWHFIHNTRGQIGHWKRRAEAAERALADAQATVARVEALGDMWDGNAEWARNAGLPAFTPAKVLRAALAGPEPEATKTPKTLAEALGMTPEDEAAMSARLRKQFDAIRESERRAADHGNYIIGAAPEATDCICGDAFGPEECPVHQDDDAWRQGCDCTELCSMGPTCPGGSLAGLPGSGCWRTKPEATEGDQRVHSAIEQLLAQPKVARCVACGRSTWDADAIGHQCLMAQPDGSQCPGVFEATEGGA